MPAKKISVTLNKPQGQFLQMKHKFRGFVGGYGCVHPDTKIWTDTGLKRISDISSLTRVLSFDETNQIFRLSLSAGSFPKGKGSLYRVVTTQGEFVASGHHHVFSSDYKYVPVDSLNVGDELNSFSLSHEQTKQALDQKLFFSDDCYLSQKDEDSMVHYANEARLYGQQFLSAKDIGQVCFQEQVYAQELSLKDGLDDSWQKDDFLEQLSIHNHQELSSCQKQSDRLRIQVQNQRIGEDNQIEALFFEHTFDSHLKKKQFHENLKNHCIKHKSFFGGYSFIIPSKVLSVTVEEESVYYDMQVVNTHNYVCENGLIHHNSSKTYSGCIAMCQHFYQHPGINQGYFAPTYPHIRDIFFPTIEEVAFKMGLDVEIKEGNKEVHFYSGKKYRGTTICRSMEKAHTIVGFKIGHALIDEFDVLPFEKAETAWRKIIARMRYNVSGLKNGIDVTTTPEGFKYTHKLFVELPQEKTELKENYGLIQASTYDNEMNLPDDYIPSLIESYPEQLIQAYLKGEFVNLTAGTVYRNYDKDINNSNEYIKEKEPLYIGMDFNVANMSAVICVKRECNIHAVEELIGVYDTPDIIRIIKERWQDHGHQIYVYPDASGGARKTVDASISDLALLERAGFIIRARSANPPVKDRVISMNNAFEKCRLFINRSKCKDLSSCLLKLAYDKNGEPDKKSGFDHRPDALGYHVYYEMPIYKPGITTTFDMNF